MLNNPRISLNASEQFIERQPSRHWLVQEIEFWVAPGVGFGLKDLRGKAGSPVRRQFTYIFDLHARSQHVLDQGSDIGVPQEFYELYSPPIRSFTQWRDSCSFG
jgi:hypothetical protein